MLWFSKSGRKLQKEDWSSEITWRGKQSYHDLAAPTFRIDGEKREFVVIRLLLPTADAAQTPRKSQSFRWTESGRRVLIFSNQSTRSYIYSGEVSQALYLSDGSQFSVVFVCFYLKMWCLWLPCTIKGIMKKF